MLFAAFYALSHANQRSATATTTSSARQRTYSLPPPPPLEDGVLSGQLLPLISWQSMYIIHISSSEGQASQTPPVLKREKWR
jgi:hypothetical protein